MFLNGKVSKTVGVKHSRYYLYKNNFTIRKQYRVKYDNELQCHIQRMIV